MRLNINYKAVVSEIICLLYVLLFVYAAVSKFLDFENFQVQLGQSPLISAYAGFLSYFIPIIEIILALLLVFLNLRLVGLYLSFFLMSLFSAYIYVILTFSPFVPCSCGGVLQNMNWHQHFYFNLGFVFLGGLAVFLLHQKPSKLIFFALVVSFLSSFLLIYALFHTSTKMQHQRNNFTRNFPHHPIKALNVMDLGINSYYIAGIDAKSIFLGNHTAPLTVTEIDTSLRIKKQHLILLPKSNRAYKSLTLSIDSPYFYIWDGISSFVYWGKIGEWNATLLLDGSAYFTSFVPVSPNHASIRAISSETNESVLGTVTFKDAVKVQLYPDILVKQIDGLFDTDGTHLYNKQKHKIIYTYYYRNQYIVSDSLMKNKYYGKTIDTTNKAQLKVKYINSLQGSKLSIPVVTVNKKTATFGTNLYVHAGLLGLYEPKENWEHNSIIDVYDFTANTYLFSFYIDDQMQNKVKDFRVYEDIIYALNGNFIRTYQLKKGFY
jgi:hypothetical protein